MALAKRKGAGIACLQGTLFDGNHGYFFFSLNRSAPRQKDGFMIAISTNFARTQIRCVHHWMPGRILGCGEGRGAGDVYVIRRMHQCMMREHKQRHPSLFELNSGEKWTESFVRSQADAE